MLVSLTVLGDGLHVKKNFAPFTVLYPELSISSPPLESSLTGDRVLVASSTRSHLINIEQALKSFDEVIVEKPVFQDFDIDMVSRLNGDDAKRIFENVAFLEHDSWGYLFSNLGLGPAPKVKCSFVIPHRAMEKFDGFRERLTLTVQDFDLILGEVGFYPVATLEFCLNKLGVDFDPNCLEIGTVGDCPDIYQVRYDNESLEFMGEFGLGSYKNQCSLEIEGCGSTLSPAYSKPQGKQIKVFCWGTNSLVPDKTYEWFWQFHVLLNPRLPSSFEMDRWIARRSILMQFSRMFKERCL